MNFVSPSSVEVAERKKTSNVGISTLPRRVPHSDDADFADGVVQGVKDKIGLPANNQLATAAPGLKPPDARELVQIIDAGEDGRPPVNPARRGG